MANKTLKTKNMNELSTIGLRTSGGVIEENCEDLFRHPLLVPTCEQMMNDETLYTAVNAIKSIIRRVKWDVGYPDTPAPTTEELAKADFIKSCMNDMEDTWADFVNESVSFIIYGFSLHEKVFKYRNEKNSKYSDGKVGWKKLPPRAQNTIKKWNFDDKVRYIKTVEQEVTNSYNSVGHNSFTRDLSIPYKKLLHFKHDCQKGNPEGTTPLKACYNAYRYKNIISEFEAIGVSKGYQGVPKVGLPAEYLSEDASDDKKAVYAYFKEVVQSLHANESAGVVMPRAIDAETKQDLFSFDLLSVDSTSQFDTDKIINRYDNKILMAFIADVLKMGTDSVGSLALSDNKTALFGVFIEAILREFTDVINKDLIMETATFNGWDVSKPLPQVMHEDLDERDLDKLGTYIQRLVSVGAMEVDQNLADYARKVAKLPVVDPEKPVREDLVNPASKDSEAGQRVAEAGSSDSNRVSGGKQSGVST